jgi:hypothetical protein
MGDGRLELAGGEGRASSGSGAKVAAEPGQGREWRVSELPAVGQQGSSKPAL